MTILALAVPAAAAIGAGAESRIDGRNLRAEHTRRRIVAATRALLEETYALPKVAEIALRAGVSVRSVFQHFQEVESLFLVVFDEILHEAEEQWQPVEPTGPLTARIDMLVARRAALCEHVLSVRFAAISMEASSPAMSERAKVARALARQHIERAFRPELDRLAPADRRQTLDALRAALDWDMWMNMRRIHGLSVEEAQAVWHKIVTALMGAEA
jgi:AcrR family transcriptional regulator